MVSAYNVMEDEFFLDFQSRQMGRKTKQCMSDTAVVMQKKKFYMCILTAIVGFLSLVAIAFFVRMYVNPQKAERGSQRYTQMIGALADSNGKAVSMYLEQGIADSPEKLDDRFWMAWFYGRQGDRGKQAEALQEILAIDGENAYACKELIRIYVEADDFEGLHEFYERCADSSLAGLFTDYLVEPPVIEMPESLLWAGDMLTINASEGLNVYYTLDGSSPVTNGTLYYAPIRLEAGSYVLQAAACNERGYYSPVVSQELTVEKHYQLGMPQVTPKSGEYLSPQRIYVNVPEGCSAYYTWNGSNPTTASRKYNGGISMPEGNNVLSVILVDAYGNVSSVQRVNYIYMPQ